LPKTLLESVAEGRFVMKAESPDPAAYAVVSVWTAAPNEQLNFLKNTVTIKFNDLAIKGSADPKGQVFILSLFSDSPLSMQTSSAFKFRLTGDGDLIVGLGDKGVQGQALWTSHLSLPIKSATLTLSPTGVKVALVDADGAKEQDIPWATAPAAWAQAVPYFNLETHRNPGTGDVVTTLGSLTVESAPATPAK
jgi:hypothetical protein